MGSVYLARASGPAGFERHVVIKMLEAWRDDDDQLAMFLDEARVIGRMHHQHIAPAHELDQDEEGRYFLVMDYVHGQTAKSAWEASLDIGAPLPIGFTLTVVCAAASALNYAHTLRARDGGPLRIIHRDVSPSNLMIGYDGAIKLIDFGIAKAAQRVSMTRIGYRKGKVAYMAPEQVSGEDIDHRVDIFALGIVLYELATMTRAFRASSDFDTLEKIRTGRWVAPSRVVEGFPRDLERIIGKAMQFDRGRRYSDADSLRRDLEAYARRNSIELGDAAIIPVMELLFDEREEPWQAAAPEPVVDEIATVPVVMPRPPTPTPTPTPRLAQPDGGGGLEPIHDAPTRPLTGPGLLGMPVPQVDLVSVPPKPFPLGSSSYMALVEPRRRRWPWLAAVGVIAAALLAVELWPATPEHALAPHAAPPRVVVTPLPPPPVSAPAPAPASVAVRITTTPDDATVLLDGEKLGHTPLDLEVPVAPGPHTIKIRRRGYFPQKLIVDLGADVSREVVLQPAE